MLLFETMPNTGPTLRLLLRILWSIITLNQKITKLMATIDERFDAVEGMLEEASTEIVTLIQELRDQLGTLTPEQEAKLQAIEASAKGLADIVPNASA